MSWMVLLLLPLAVGAQTIPALLAGAGASGWAAPLLMACPPAGLMAWLGRWRINNPGVCPSQMAVRCWGAAAGLAVQAVWALWALAMASYIMHSLSERLVVTVFPVRSPWPHVAAGLLLCGLMAKGRDPALFRAAKLFAAGALGLCGLVLCFVPQGLQWRYLAPRADNWPAFPGVLPGALAVCSLVIFGFFLLGPVDTGGHQDPRPRWWQMLTIGPALAVMAAVTMGTFGPILTASTPSGFFWAIKNAAIPGGLRIEAIFVMVWLILDLTVVSLLMRAALLFTRRSGWYSAATAAALVAAGTLVMGLFDQRTLEALLLWVSAGLMLGLPVLMLLFRQRARIG